MTLHQRYLLHPANEILEDRRMLFVAGPRQVGKTTFVKKFKGSYLNYDDLADRKEILKYSFPKSNSLVIFDEIHKYRLWRTLVKGLYDKHHEDLKIIVTGSARLDYYRKGGDSLLGRYQLLRMHPFSLFELNKKPNLSDLKLLLQFGGFPAPLFKQSEKFHRIWSLERESRLLREDLLDLEKVKDVSLLELLITLLPEKVGSILSVKSLKEDLNVAHQTVDRWLSIFESLYLVYRIYPYGPPKVKAVKKEGKLYFIDWSQVKNEGARFENFVASHLLKYCHFIQDTEGHKMELRFLRNTEGKEIDFVVLKDKKPMFAVECKHGEKQLSPAIKYFAPRTPIPLFFQVHLGEKDYGDERKGGRVLPFSTFGKIVELV